MKNVAFVTSGFLPVPASKGGAVESLVQNLIEENEKEMRAMFTVFSIYDKTSFEKSKKYKNTNVVFYKPFVFIIFLDYLLYFFLTSILKKEKKMSYRYIIQRIFYLNFVSKKLKKNNYSSVIIENNTTLFLALKWRRNFIKYEGRYYFHLHNDIDNFYGCKKIIESSCKILTVSNYIANIVHKKLDFPVNKICVLKNCIDMSKFSDNYSDVEKMQLRKKLGISQNDKVIVFVGRTIKEKGIIEVIKAFNKISDKNYKLLLIGSSGFNIKVTSEFERELLTSVKNNKNIIFTGFVPYENIGIYYSISDVAVLPSIWDEPAGLTMLEAVASGVPLITTDSGGIPEYVKKFNSIILSRNENLINNIVDSISLVLENKFSANKEFSTICQSEFNLKNYLDNFIFYIDRGD